MTQKMAAPPDDDDDDNVADADDECGHHKEREGNQGEVSLKQSIGGDQPQTVDKFPFTFHINLWNP